MTRVALYARYSTDNQREGFVTLPTKERDGPAALEISSSRDGVVKARWACGPAGGRITERMKKISYAGYRFPPE
jgi:hypothetical protein